MGLLLDPAPDAAFVITTVIPGETPIAVATVVGSLDVTEQVDLTTAIEIRDLGLAVGPDRGNAVFLLDGSVPRLQRFDLDGDGNLIAGPILSTEEFSTTSRAATAGNFVFLSETKAYVIDTLSWLIIVWDPKAMEIRGTIDISEASIPNGGAGLAATRLAGDRAGFSPWATWGSMVRCHNPSSCSLIPRRTLSSA